MRELVNNLKKLGVLKSPKIIEAFLANDRRRFVASEYADLAYEDMPLPIGAGQTISQPYTVAFMLELLQPQPGQKILDIGAGSGWTAALLAHIVGPKGKVYALEVVPELCEFARANFEKFHYPNLELKRQSGWEGLPARAPFDRILVSAAARAVPRVLKQQLGVPGRMVIPVGGEFIQSVKLIEKTAADKLREKDYPGFAFVPFVK
ncbi:MAG: protein-L-isoaspartate(D-aspartate) O-methyltransferase [Candidatus Doudnabacteria bacterium]|nr:protein-L-isoaspartate(D-aspartate) O-methyltransferase [Candidatus Doudnabacteria bacterium]